MNLMRAINNENKKNKKTKKTKKTKKIKKEKMNNFFLKRVRDNGILYVF